MNHVYTTSLKYTLVMYKHVCQKCYVLYSSINVFFEKKPISRKSN